MRQLYYAISDYLRRVGAAHPAMIYCAFVTMLLFSIMHSGTAIVQVSVEPVTRLLVLGDEKPVAAKSVVEPKSVSAVLEGDEWLQNLKTKWVDRSRSNAKPSNLGNSAGIPAYPTFGFPALGEGEGLDGEDRLMKGGRGTLHRTMCVRLCDGYYFPISFATTGDRFDDDERACQRSCSTPAKLYVYRNPGQDPEDMVSLSGQPYKKLMNAFLFRTKLDQSCKCNPHPWEQEATDRHRKYAEDAARSKVQRQAALDAAAAKSSKSSKSRSKGTPVGAIFDQSNPPTATKRADAAPPPASVTAMTVSADTRIALLNVAAAPAASAAGEDTSESSKARAGHDKPRSATSAKKKAPSAFAASPIAPPKAPTAAPLPRPMRLGAASDASGGSSRPRADWRQSVFATH